jgi:hypothetical protein
MIVRFVHALAAATAALLLASAAQAHVGVATAVDGEPKAAASGGAARVLQIGVDLQRGETISTRANERVHLVFLDGTSLTVGPEAEVAIDRFDYDPVAKKGELALTVSRGVIRLVGGHIGKSGAIAIKTPSSDLSLQGGIAIVDVTADDTTAAFIFGLKLTVAGAGRREVLTRPGSSITTTAGNAPQPPIVLPPGVMEALLSPLARGTGQGVAVAAADIDQRAAELGLLRHGPQEPLAEMFQYGRSTRRP